MRPTVKQGDSQRMDDDLSHKLCDIIKVNNQIKTRMFDLTMTQLGIDKKLIKELVDNLSEFNLTELEYQEGQTKIKVSKATKGLVEQNKTSATVEFVFIRLQQIKFYRGIIPKIAEPLLCRSIG